MCHGQGDLYKKFSRKLGATIYILMHSNVMNCEELAHILKYSFKSEEGRIQKANLSLEIDDEFMECVKKYYDTGEIVKKEITRDYEGNKVTYEVVPIELYKLMMKTAYDWAEPGCIFVNPFRNFNLMEFCDDYNIECCNPCGEQPLAKNSACNLASLNISEFVNDEFTANNRFIICARTGHDESKKRNLKTTRLKYLVQ